MRIPDGRLLPPAVAIAAGIAAAAWYGFVLVRRAGMLLARAYDQGFFQAVVWNVAHGHGFTAGFWPRSFLGLHFSPLLGVPAGLELLWPDARALSLLHALALGAAAPAAYLLLTAMLPARSESRIVAAALAAPLPAWLLVQQAAAADFHPEAIALPLLLLAGWAGLTGRTALLFGLAVAALAAREDQAYGALLLGVVLVAAGRVRAGAGLAALAAGWAMVVTAVVMPWLRGPVPSQVDYYAWLHGAGAGDVLAALLRPAGWLQVAAAIAGTAGLPLLRPLWLLAALPPIALDLLSSHDPQPTLGFQYGLPLVLPVLVAAAFGARAAIERGWFR
ncbi:MAG TPA: DUF2079 domain-containing protein, partial [Candidatus Dormibacteraeota bacterium]|nr:DUF2079 domain-containing protein [Candidatus Dormibacteraeota bacterium]